MMFSRMMDEMSTSDPKNGKKAKGERKRRDASADAEMMISRMMDEMSTAIPRMWKEGQG
jgi:hypothetical protein